MKQTDRFSRYITALRPQDLPLLFFPPQSLTTQPEMANHASLRLTTTIPETAPLETMIKIHTPRRCIERTGGHLHDSIINQDDFLVLARGQRPYKLLRHTLRAGYIPVIEIYEAYTDQMRVIKIQDYLMFLVSSGILMVKETKDKNNRARQDEACQKDWEVIRAGLGGGEQSRETEMCECGALDVPPILGLVPDTPPATPPPSPPPPPPPRDHEVEFEVEVEMEQAEWEIDGREGIGNQGLLDLMLYEGHGY